MPVNHSTELRIVKVCRRDCIDRLVLVNPATSYEQSIWPIVGPLISQIPNELYTGLSFALAPLLGNPLSLIAYKVDASKPFPAQMNDIVEVRKESPVPFSVYPFCASRVYWSCLGHWDSLEMSSHPNASPGRSSLWNKASDSCRL